MINSLSFIPREDLRNSKSQRIHEIGFLVGLLILIVVGFLVFYLASVIIPA